MTTSSSSSLWNLSEIQSNARNWSLQGDAKLLDFMKTISENLDKRCKATNSNINNMMLELDKTNIRLENTTNKMLSIKNLQFMEARVHDEVDTTTNTANNSLSGTVGSGKLNKNKLTDLTTLKAIQLAVGNGLNMMHRCYEKVTLDLDDDSDADEDSAFGHKSIVFRSKNPHQDRPLPFLIGSKEWNEKWHIGLVDSDEEVSNDGRGDNNYSAASDDESVSLSASSVSDVPTVSDTDQSRRGSPSSQQTSGTENGPEIFQPDLYTSRPLPKVQVPFTVPGQLIEPQPPKQQHKITNLFNETDSESDDEIQIREPHHSYQHNKTNDANSTIFRNQKPELNNTNVVSAQLFDDNPPELNIPSRAERKTTNLFLDSDDDDPIFSSNTESATLPKKSSFEHSTSHLIFSDPDHIPVAAPRLTKQPVNIFDDVDDNDDLSLPSPKVVAKSNMTKLFDEKPPNDLFQDISKPAKSTDTMQSILTPKRNIFDEDDDDDDNLFKSLITPKNLASATEIKSKQTISFLDNLFDDEPPDDYESLFSTDKRTSVKSIKPNVSESEERNSNILDVDAANKTPPIPNKEKVKEPILVKQSLFLEPKDANIFDNNDDESQTRSSLQGITPNRLDNVRSETDNILTEERSPSTKAQQFANFYVQNEHQSHDTKMIANRRPFVSFLDNEEPDFDDWDTIEVSKGSIDSNATTQKVNFEDPLTPHNSETIENSINSEQSTGIMGNNNLFDGLPTENYFSPSQGSNKSSEKSISDARSTLERNINYSGDEILQQHDMDNLDNNSKEVITSTLDLFADIPPDDELFATTASKSNVAISKNSVHSEVKTNQCPSDGVKPMMNLNATAGPLGLFDDIPPDDDLFPTSSVTISKKSGHLDIEADKSPLGDTILQSHEDESVKNLEASANTRDLFDNIPPDDELFATNASKSNVTISKSSVHSDLDTNKFPSGEEHSVKKSKVAASSVNLFDDMPPNDDLFAFTASKPSVPISKNSVHSDLIANKFPSGDTTLHVDEKFVKNAEVTTITLDLFDDIPPEDEIFAAASASTQRATTSAGLFDDLPPDDDIFTNVIEPGEKNKLKSVYYDDFSDTIIEPPKHTLASSYSMFDDEPPPDIDEVDDLSSSSTKAFDTNSMLTQKYSSLPVEKPPSLSEPREKPTQKILKHNLNINVAALMPGAKIPSFKSAQTKTSSSETVTAVPIPVKRTTTDASTNDSNSLLPNLNKSRARIQVSRKPSTRRGRQDEYRKSLTINISTEEFENHESTNNTDQLKHKSIEDLSQMQDRPSIEDMLKSTDIAGYSVTPINDDQILTKADSILQSGDNDDNWLFTKRSSTNNNPISRPVDGEEDIFSEISISKKLDVSNKPIIPEELNEFSDKLEIKKNPGPGNLFSDEDDDDLFSSLSKKISNKNTSKLSEIPPQVPVASKNINKSSKQANVPTKGLFDDDSESESNVFSHATSVNKNGKLDSATRKTSQGKPAKISGGLLFGDEDEDDDLFGSNKGQQQTSNLKVGSSKGISGKQNIKSPAAKPAQIIAGGDPLTDLLK